MALVKCDCRGNQFGTHGAAFQDSQYGKGVRVANPFKKSAETAYRCTICKREHTQSTLLRA